MGHKLVLSTTVGTTEQEVVSQRRQSGRQSLLSAKAEGVLAGLGLIFGLTGVCYGVRQRRLRRRT